MANEIQLNTRRSFLQRSSVIATSAAISTSIIPKVHAGEDNTIKIALVGCGGRGTGAAREALSVDNGPIKLIAVADVSSEKVRRAAKDFSDSQRLQAKVDITTDRMFTGFDAYKNAMDCLSAGDVVILATPPAFRWVHYKYAIERGLNVFMEKPVSVDAPTSVRMLNLNKLALAKNLKVGVGLMCRHCHARQELFNRIQSGEIGSINMLRAYRLAGVTASEAVRPNQTDDSELMYQIKNFHGFLWLSGGAVSDFLIHNIDEACWMKNAWPVKAIGLGGRHYRGDNIDQNFDTYAIEYTFADGAKLFVDGRTIPGCYNQFATYVHGSKGMAVVSSESHTPAKSRIYKTQSINSDQIAWQFPQPEPNPYQLEWNDLIAAIRNDTPYNEVERGVMASAVTSMGRMAAHTGQELTLDAFMKVEHEFAPGIADLTMNSASPLQADADGKYSVPMPGLVKDREYL